MQPFLVVVVPSLYRYLVFAKDGADAMAKAKRYGGHASNAAAEAQPLTVARETSDLPSVMLLTIPHAGFSR